jgi:hypothetical protein
MDLNSTPFISYSEINVEAADLYEDAWGFNSEFHDVISLLGEIDTSPGDLMADRLIMTISGHD